MSRTLRIPRISVPYFRFSFLGWFSFILIALSGLLTPNPLLTAVSVLVIPFLALLTWRRGEPPVLLFIVMLQWLQVSTKIYHANSVGMTVREMSGLPEIHQAILLGFVGILVLAGGLRWAADRLESQAMDQMRAGAIEFSLDRLFAGYLISFLFSLFCRGAIWVNPGLSQILNTLSHLKWVMFFLLAYSILLRRQKRVLLYLAMALEILLGYTGYFSEFKKPFYILFIAVLSQGYRLTLRNLFKSGVVVGTVLLLAIGWTSFSEHYRDYVNAGSGSQVTVVPVRSRLAKVFDLYMNIDIPSFKEGFERLLGRVAYVDLFARVLERVPNTLPHEKGALLLRVFHHLLTPRLLFPEKPSLGDTELTEKYTGMTFGRYTSVSVGYMTDSYIDFGRVGMFFQIFGLGLISGLIYRYFVSRPRMKLFGYAFAVTILTNSFQIETSLINLVGWLVTGFIVLSLAQKFLVPPVNLWLMGKR